MNIPVPIRAALLGVLTGGRSATPIAMLALHHGREPLRGEWEDWPVFRHPAIRALLAVAAAGELIGDKLPATPSRLHPLPLAGRALTGAIVGAAVGSVDGHKYTGALLGGVGGMVGSVLGARYRTAIGAATHLPDPLVALLEDAVVVGGSAALVTTR